MADRLSKTPKKEGTISSSVKKRSDNRANKSRSPIITRSKSRSRDDIECTDTSSITNRRLKRSSADYPTNEKKSKVLSEVHVKVKSPSQGKANSSSQEVLPEQNLTKSKVEEAKISKKAEKRASGTRKKVESDTPKTLNLSKKLKKSTSVDDFKSKDSLIQATHNKSLVMDQNGANFSSDASNNNTNSSNSNESSQLNPSTSNILSNFSINSHVDAESEESDMSRLQTILESRGLHPHFLGIPRMQNFFYRSFNNSSNTKAQQLLHALNSTTNESEKLQYVLEMCQLLLMGNEDTLVGFPIKSVVPTLINLLSMEHNFEIMHHACRALTYMMEALPRSSIIVLDAIPVFLEKLQVIQCMDVAEQSLSALEMLSRRHNKAILHARGVSACLTYLDFFSIDAQRSALTITANCFQSLTTDDFQYVQDSLPILSSHLSIEDKKCIESICLAFSRLVDCYQQDCAIISEIASSELLTNIQNVLMAVPVILPTGSFVNVIRMLSIMCYSCPQIAVELLKLNICETLKYLLLCNNSLTENSDSINLVSRSPQEIYEITSFIAELMPILPLDGLFSVDLLFSKSNNSTTEVAIWQWKDDRGLWHPFNVVDNKIIESAHQSGEDELELASLNRTYIIDFNSMQKIYEDTGNSYAIQRKINTLANAELITRSNMQNIDPRSEFIYKEIELSGSFIKFIFNVLNEVYSNSAGFSVRYKCLNAILRIIYYSPKELLNLILKDQSMSSSIATMLASSDIRIVVCATQMCSILMEKMPEIFSIYFQREGVIHQIRKLYLDESRFNIDKSSVAHDSKDSNTIVLSNSQSLPTSQSFVVDKAQLFLNRSREKSNDSLSQVDYLSPNNISSLSVSHNVSKSSNTTRSDQVSGRTEEILKRKRTRKNIAVSTTNSRNAMVGFDNLHNAPSDNNSINISSTESDICNNLTSSYMNFPLFVSETVNSTNLAINNNKNNTRLGSSKDFLQRLNPTRWTRWNQNPASNTNSVPTTSNITTKDLSTIQKSTNLNKENIKSWIKEQAKTFDKNYFYKSITDEKEVVSSSNILNDLTNAINMLNEDSSKALFNIKTILLESDISSFELIHSGLVKNFLSYLVSNDHSNETREANLRTFLNVFYGAPLTTNIENIDELSLDSKPLSILINKLNACVSQLEQFPLQVHDCPNTSSGRGAHAIKFLNSHFLKISLNRHPSCTNLRRYKGPLIKLDPFTSVQSIERYLLTRGYGKIKDVDDEPSDDDVSDEDLIDNITINSSSQAQKKQRLQLLIGDYVLAYNISIYQGIKQYLGNDYQDNESDNDNHFGNSKFWSATFFIYYRLVNESSVNSTPVSNNTLNTRSSRKSKSNKSSSKKKDEVWLEGKIPSPVSPLESYLNVLSFNISINDQSIEVLCLLRVLYGINRYWGYLYKLPYIYNPAIPLKEFINCKLTVKANRQLQDPLVIMTGSLPNWLSELAYSCPFMFPFDTRYLLFYVVCFDRERALQRLFENVPDLSSLDSRERSIVPRLEKRKRIVSRNDIFKSADSLFNDLGNSKSLLEIQYENEVGTGLGPTLEFYALVSKEFQRADFEMWNGEIISNFDYKNEKSDRNNVNYMFAANGLFPAPIGRSAKPSVVNKLKQRYKLLGKFMAKALMDSRMIDIPLNILFYKWLLNEESTLTISNIQQLDPTFSLSIIQMYNIVQRKARKNLNSNDDLLKLHGCSIDDLNLDFTLPGYSNVELRKGGKDTAVNINNLESYINLVCHWNLVEGVFKQMEAFKDGFNSVFQSSQLQLFYAEELQQLFCGASYKCWDVKMLMESCKTDHGFTHESPAIRNLFDILSSYNADEQRKFLQFLTGSPRLPIGGFKSLIPPFTIVRKNTGDSDNPDCLPSVMTCVNYLKLPNYPTIEVMREKLNIAINEGQFSFHLS